MFSPEFPSILNSVTISSLLYLTEKKNYDQLLSCEHVKHINSYGLFQLFSNRPSCFYPVISHRWKRPSSVYLLVRARTRAWTTRSFWPPEQWSQLATDTQLTRFLDGGNAVWERGGLCTTTTIIITTTTVYGREHTRQTGTRQCRLSVWSCCSAVSTSLPDIEQRTLLAALMWFINITFLSSNAVINLNQTWLTAICSNCLIENQQVNNICNHDQDV